MMQCNLAFLFSALLLPTLCFGYARSTGEIVKNAVPKVPLPSSTSSVKCKCQPVEESPEAINAQSRSDDLPLAEKEIQIQIFKSESDLQKSNEEMQQDAHTNYEPQPFKRFNAFRSSQLFDEETTVEKNPFEFLLLGKSTGPFQGPRRRRREASKGNVFYIYPVKYHEDSTNEEKVKIATTEPSSSTQKLSRVNFVYPEQIKNLQKIVETSTEKFDLKEFAERKIEVDEKENEEPNIISPSLSIDQAMSQAWLDYGPKSVPPPDIDYNSPRPVAAPTSGTFPFEINPLFQLTRVPSYSYQFQRKGDLFSSPWDNRITQNPLPTFDKDITQPGFFSPIMTRFIDFEVNNHEQADFLRKLLFAFGIGILIAAWITLGVFIGVVPLSIFFHKDERVEKRSNPVVGQGDELDSLTNRVIFALESDWLKKLEETVKKDNFVHTVAKCCIIPEKDSVECKLVEKAKSKNAKDAASHPIECGSNLIYNFQFSRDEDGNGPEDL